MSVAAQKNHSHTTFLDRGESGLHFVKYHGLGNDFIMVNNLNSMDPIVTLEQAVKLCDRNFGIGGDGIIFAMPGSNGTDYTMRIFNSDGSEPEESVFIGVTGILQSKDNVTRYFSQNFFLAPQTNGFYVAKASSLPSSNAAVKILKNEDTQSRDLPATVPAVKPSSPPKNAEGITTEAAHKVLEEEQNHKSSFTEESKGANNDDQLVENNSPDRNGQEAANKETYASIVARPIPPQASRQVLADKPSSSVVSATHVSSILPPKQVPAPSYVKTDGYRYTFVEFIQPKFARQAVQVGCIKFNDWECRIEAKKSREGL
ncbi:hypothetical protein L6452_04842 [Arctium lappa]|uniref:Uncharacterized protein n=1 Tax=Arctium lappa TaxID=4217 RepID=A0ACB9EFD2_ARCLA|nr:hypothetical protein L6452_04842 [Arctium lappa]